MIVDALVCAVVDDVGDAVDVYHVEVGYLDDVAIARVCCCRCVRRW